MMRLRFALLFDGTRLDQWHLRCLDELEPFAQLVGVIVAPVAPIAAQSAPSRLLRSYARHVARRTTVDVTQRFADVPRLHPRDDGHALDFVLRLGPVSLPTGLAAEHGIWCFAHEGDRDLLPFFREVYDTEHVTNAALLAFAGERDEAAILDEGWFRTNKASYVASRDRIVGALASWPARACRRLLAGGDTDSRVRAIEEPPNRATRRGLLRFRAATARQLAYVAWERLFRHPQWNIGVLRAPVGVLLLPGGYPDRDVEWFPLDDRRGFLADPFGIERDGKVHVLYEYFDYRESRGDIRTLDYSQNGFATDAAPALPLRVHASYPFLLERPDGVYCVPETSEAGEIVLFRADDFPRAWSKVAVLVDDFAGVDPTLFNHRGTWWLTCTQKGAYEDEELWVWHAPDLLGPWTPHARNPVKTDVRGSRPGGPPFVVDGVLYRPTQDCSRTYGWRVTVQRVLQLTPTEFAEEPTAVVEASRESPFPRGRHTLTPVGDVVLVDGRRTVFVWPALRAFLAIWARDLARKARRL
jgi:hypothetical protein